MTQHTITHRIAGITFRTDANVSFPQFKIGKFERFVCEDTQPDVRQHFHRSVFHAEFGADGIPVATQERPVLPWRDRLAEVMAQTEQIEVMAGKDRAIIRNFSQRELDFYYMVEMEKKGDAEHVLSDTGYSWAPTLRQIFSTFLPAFSAALIHSSAVIRNDLTALFLAPSTGGKTTVTKIFGGDAVLSDDQVILRAHENDLIMAHGTPFGRVTNGPISAKLGGLFLLEKAKSFALKPIKPLDMLEYLWNDQLIYNYFIPMELRIKAYQMFYTACQQTPCYTMSFPKDYIDWDAIDAAMKK